MKIFSQFLIWQLILIGTVLLSGAMLSDLISKDIKTNSIDRTKIIYSNFIIHNVVEHISYDSFNSNNLKTNSILFETFFKQLKNPEIIGIKVWANDATILFSNNDQIIGSKNPENQRYHRAMNGETISILRDYDNEEKLTTKSLDEILAIYVPISDENIIYGVVETYIDPTFLNNSISNTTRTLSFATMITVVIICMIIIISFQIQKKTIIDPIRKTEKLATQISKRSFKKLNTNEIQNLSENLYQIMLNQKETEKLKDEFLAMISHEIKTPLVPIQAYSEMLLSGHLGELTDNQREKITQIHSSCASLLDLTTDLLDVQKLELNQLHIDKENVNIKNMIEQTIQSIQPLVNESKISILYNANKDIFVDCDQGRISQVLNNLIKNAIKSLEYKTGIIEVFVDELDSQIKVSVKDNGIGIPKGKQNDLFKKFYQVDTSLIRENGGSGLGLAICKGIVETHGGRIWFESEEGIGTTFYFILPKKNS